MKGRQPRAITWEVKENGCWECTSHAKNRKGYPHHKRGGKAVSVCRTVYEENHGRIPVGMHVLHHCDNPSCINPEHLFVGTNYDNILDKMAKGRQGRMPGEKHPHSKLTREQAMDIILNKNVSLRKMSKKYGVAYQHVSLVRNGKAWKHLREGMA